MNVDVDPYFVRPVVPGHDLPEISYWYAARGLIPPVEHLLPADGAIVHGIGAGFLILTNSGFGILEYFITNPKVDRTARHIAMDKVAGALIKLGQEMGLNMFTAITRNPYIKELCLKHNFRELQGMRVFGRKD